MTTLKEKLVLIFIVLALCFFLKAHSSSKSRSMYDKANISKMKFWKKVSSEIIGFRHNISVIWKIVDQIYDEFNELNNTVTKKADELAEEFSDMNRKNEKTLNILSSLVECPSGWSKNGTSCYSFRTTEVTWIEAVKACHDEGAHLVEFDSQEEVKFVLDLVLGIVGRYSTNQWLGFFIGGSDRENEGEWEWESSGKNINAGFTYWHDRQPDDYGSGEDCLTSCINLNGQWNDVDCQSYRNYVCEKPVLDGI